MPMPMPMSMPIQPSPTLIRSPTPTAAPMLDDQMLIKVCVVGETALSAFITWRLQATNICDISLVWTHGSTHVQSYGLSFRSPVFGEQRFKPRVVVPRVADLTDPRQPQASKFEYIILCPSSRKDAHQLISQIRPLVSPTHTCILVDTTRFAGLESNLEKAFPNNVVLSLFSTVDVVAEPEPGVFLHRHSTSLFVSPVVSRPSLSTDDVIGTLSETLTSVQVDCREVPSATKHMFDTAILSVVFHSSSIVFDTIHYGDMIQRIGVRAMIGGMVDEMVNLAESVGSVFPADYRDRLISSMAEQSITHGGVPNPMWDAFRAKVPINLDAYFDIPLGIAQETGVPLPRIEMVHAILRHQNYLNTRSRPTRPFAPSRTCSIQGRPPAQAGAPMSRPWSKASPPTPGLDPRAMSRQGPPRRVMSRMHPNEVAQMSQAGPGPGGLSSVASSIDNLANLGAQSHHYPPADACRSGSRPSDTQSIVYAGPDDNIDMLLITSRRSRASRASTTSPTRRAIVQSHRSPIAKDSMINEIPSVNTSLRDSALFRNCSSNRYGTVDRIESRANSMKSTSQWEAAPFSASRRSSRSPGNGNGFTPPGLAYGNSSRSNVSSEAMNFVPPMHGNQFGPEGRYPGVNSVSVHASAEPAGRNPYGQKGPHLRSLTGSASASAESGESTLDSPAQSSSSSLNKPAGRDGVGRDVVGRDVVGRGAVVGVR